MTYELEVVCCDAPNCTRSVVGVGAYGKLPDGWATIRSTAHIPDDHGRPKRGRYSTSDRCSGSFHLTVCPDHHDAFNDHHPVTDGTPYRRGATGSAVVSCSCGHDHGHVHSPSIGDTERAWRRHLPPEYRAYAERGPATGWYQPVTLVPLKSEEGDQP